jgi:DNA-binding NarL/FixJ family response regulator
MGRASDATMRPAPMAALRRLRTLRIVRVLLVDDSRLVRLAVSQMLREASIPMTIEEASTAREALSAATARRPDVVLLDLRLPGGSGLDIVADLKAIRPHAPVVVVLTNCASEQHRRRAMALGADAFFDKSREFARALDVACAAANARPSDGRRHEPPSTSDTTSRGTPTEGQ